VPAPSLAIDYWPVFGSRRGQHGKSAGHPLQVTRRRNAEMSNSPLVGCRSPRKWGFWVMLSKTFYLCPNWDAWGNTHQGILRGRQRHTPSPHCLWDLTGPHLSETKALPTERARAAHRRTRRHLYRSSPTNQKGGIVLLPLPPYLLPENWAIVPHTFPLSAMVGKQLARIGRPEK
jgi:hypothetical protein